MEEMDTDQELPDVLVYRDVNILQNDIDITDIAKDVLETIFFFLGDWDHWSLRTTCKKMKEYLENYWKKRLEFIGQNVWEAVISYHQLSFLKEDPDIIKDEIPDPQLDVIVKMQANGDESMFSLEGKMQKIAIKIDRNSGLKIMKYASDEFESTSSMTIPRRKIYVKVAKYQDPTDVIELNVEEEALEGCDQILKQYEKGTGHLNIRVIDGIMDLKVISKIKNNSVTKTVTVNKSGKLREKTRFKHSGKPSYHGKQWQ